MFDYSIDCKIVVKLQMFQYEMHLLLLLFQIHNTVVLCIHNILQLYYVYITEKAMAPNSSTLAWKIPWMEEPGRLQSMGLRRVGHD